jgi:hypothetical protein
MARSGILPKVSKAAHDRRRLLRRPDRGGAAGIGESPVLVFIESELLGYLVLTADEAAELSTALHEASRRSVERGEE